MILGTNGATPSSRRCRLEGLLAGADALLNFDDSYLFIVMSGALNGASARTASAHAQ
jgi:hypothetical protein